MIQVDPSLTLLSQDLPADSTHEHLSIMARWVREQKLDTIRTGLAPLVWTLEELQSLSIPRTYGQTPIVGVEFQFGGTYKTRRRLQIVANLSDDRCVVGYVVNSLKDISFSPSKDKDTAFYIYFEPDSQTQRIYVQPLSDEAEADAFRRVSSLRNLLLGAADQWAQRMRLAN